MPEVTTEETKTRSQLMLEQLQAQVARVQEMIAAEAEIAKDFGLEEMKLAAYLHEEFCSRCQTAGPAAACAFSRMKMVAPDDLTKITWTLPEAKVWLTKAAKLVADAPSLGWTMS